MFKEYFGADAGKIGYFFGLMAGAAISVTLIYWAIFGFDTWKEETQRASDLMMAAAVVPQGSAAGQGVGQRIAQRSGQYVCPRDGAVGLPQFDGNGVPHCPVCGQVMGFNNTQPNNLALARGG
ncbi:MAG TPA: hypothetical protein HPP58_00115 [Deltaproteobacteria bacterium]|nr:hypothetical protein [Deltaproteobacteria bacterium]HIJ39646.1 hypothetical protein [Deltaproteobacteria bacterium]